MAGYQNEVFPYSALFKLVSNMHTCKIKLAPSLVPQAYLKYCHSEVPHIEHEKFLNPRGPRYM